MRKEKRLYLCDGTVESCKKIMCYKNGGACHHTSDPKHSLTMQQGKIPKLKFIKSVGGYKFFAERNPQRHPPTLWLQKWAMAYTGWVRFFQ